MATIVLQRVLSASVRVSGQTIAAIDRGFLLLLGIAIEDTEEMVDRLADKVAVLRLFSDSDGKMNLSCKDVGGAMLVVSQFTLLGSVTKGRRPSFGAAAHPEVAERLYIRFVRRLASHGYAVQTGEFGAHMLVSLENDGPVTLLLDSREL